MISRHDIAAFENMFKTTVMSSYEFAGVMIDSNKRVVSAIAESNMQVTDVLINASTEGFKETLVSFQEIQLDCFNKLHAENPQAALALVQSTISDLASQDAGRS